MKIPITYGIVCGLIISIWIVAGYYFQWYTTGFANFWLLLAYLIQIIGLFLGLKVYKDKKFQGGISYVTALYAGLIITFFLTIIYSFSTFIYFNNSGNEILNFALTESEKALIQMKKPLSEINENVKLLKESFTPSNQAKSAFIEKFIIGLFFSLVFATILRKRDNVN
jgi:hypothetical protein